MRQTSPLCNSGYFLSAVLSIHFALASQAMTLISATPSLDEINALLP